jgi:hypothetical protein
MRPNDDNGRLPIDQRPFRVLVIAGSQRRQYSCPSADSKARALMLRMSDRLPKEWEIDLEDIGNVLYRERIASCNGCVSTSMALCVWPCNCYRRGDHLHPDLMWDLDLYARLDLADAWAFVAPVNWYGPSSNMKAMFDRLVCMNGGNPDAARIGRKDPDKAIALEKDPEWKELSRNHLEGRSAAFFCYGDGGGDELDESGRPKILRHPAYFDPEKEPWDDMRDSYAGLVWQCRYGGVEVPDELWTYEEFGRGRPYSENQAEHMIDRETEVMARFDRWVDRFVAHVARKGKVPPGKYRAYGHREPGHAIADMKLLARDLRVRLGKPYPGTSPAIQQERGINRDVTMTPQDSERTRNPKE